MPISKFQRGLSTYRCQSCGKLTRNTHGEWALGICAKCEELGGLENALSDGDVDAVEFAKIKAEIEARYA